MKNETSVPKASQTLGLCTHLGGALDDEEHFLVRPAFLVEIVTLEHHTALRDVHESQEMHGA